MDNRHEELLTAIVNIFEKNTVAKDVEKNIEVKGGITKQNPKGDGFKSQEERYEGLLKLEKEGYIKLCSKYKPKLPYQNQKDCITILKKEFEE